MIIIKKLHLFNFYFRVYLVLIFKIIQNVGIIIQLYFKDLSLNVTTMILYPVHSQMTGLLTVGIEKCSVAISTAQEKNDDCLRRSQVTLLLT